MAELTTLARPYAKGAFEAALAHEQLDSWSESLARLAGVLSDPDMQRAVSHPGLTADQKIALINDICGGELPEPVGNFLHILADNRRLLLIPAIADMFKALRHDHERTVEINLTTAFDMTPEQEANLSQALGRKLDRRIQLSLRTDRSIIGGVLIEAGDMVIDASVRGKLARMADAIGS
ncbi:MAG: F0F1 ATP synthase subunit delta [Halomonadaceae bacterium]|nr:MAG: F0F1 ATP synthase subunit delta [Halomonadaceae bacterium]